MGTNIAHKMIDRALVHGLAFAKGLSALSHAPMVRNKGTDHE